MFENTEVQELQRTTKDISFEPPNARIVSNAAWAVN